MPAAPPAPTASPSAMTGPGTPRGTAFMHENLAPALRAPVGKPLRLEPVPAGGAPIDVNGAHFPGTFHFTDSLPYPRTISDPAFTIPFGTENGRVPEKWLGSSPVGVNSLIVRISAELTV